MNNSNDAMGEAFHAAAASGPDSTFAVVNDAYYQDYDIRLALKSEKCSFLMGSKLIQSSRFEARPSIAYDPAGRLWIAYEEGPELWGKDFGALDDSDGQPL